MAGGMARWRRWAPWALTALAAVVLLAGTLAVWAKRQALDTGAWGDASAELIRDDATREAVAGYLAGQALVAGDVQSRLERVLPPRLEPLAPALSASLTDAARRLALDILSRPAFQDRWVAANRRAHGAFLDLVEGREGALAADGGAVVLDLRPLLTELAGRFGVADRLAPGAGRLRVADAAELDGIRRVVRAIRVLSQLLVPLALVLGAAAVWSAGRGRRRTVVMALGGAMVLAGLVLLAARRAAGEHVAGMLSDGAVDRGVALHAWSVGTDLLRDIAVATAAYGALAVAAAWLAGPGRAAFAARRWAAPLLRTRPWASAAVAAALCLALLAWGPGSGDRRLAGVVVLAALFAVAVAVLWRQAVREFPARGPGSPSRSAPY
ncbi:MAG: hypothetical protein U0237_07400 [Thermoleophilia bacterium]